jgi:ArsR family transcriptional regulator
MMDEKRYSKFFKAFGGASRTKILMLLSSKAMTVNDIVDKLDLSQPTVSRHLAVLREAGAISDSRQGQQVFYSLNKKAIENCCVDFCCCLETPGAKKQKKKKN